MNWWKWGCGMLLMGISGWLTGVSTAGMQLPTNWQIFAAVALALLSGMVVENANHDVRQGPGPSLVIRSDGFKVKSIELMGTWNDKELDQTAQMLEGMAKAVRVSK